MAFVLLPPGYQAVEYIESTGEQYIDTGVAYNSNLSFETVASFIDKDTVNGLFGTDDYIFSAYMRTDGTAKFQNKQSQRFVSTVLNLNTFYDFKANVNGFWVDGVLSSAESDSGNIPTSNIFISKSCKYWGRIKIESFRMYSDSNFTTIIRDYVPCYRKSDGEIGLFDKVNNVFYTNDGTGEFLKGEDVPCGCIFQPGIVGKTNVVEGAVIPCHIEQIVNYTMLYYYGDECEDITGGWQTQSEMGSTGSRSKNADNLYVRSNVSNSTTYSNAMYETKNYLEREGYAGMAAQGTVTEKDSNSIGGHLTFNPPENIWGQHHHVAEIFDKVETKAIKCVNFADGFYGNQFAESGRVGIVARNGKLQIYCYAVWLYKEDDWESLCTLAGISVPSDIETLLADTDSITAILSKKRCVDTMINHCTGEFMSRAVRNSTFITALNSSPYKTVVQANEHWAKFLAMVA